MTNFRSHSLRILGLLLGFLALALLSPAGPAAAQSSGLTITASAGLDNLCKVGTWLPVRVILENNGDDLNGKILTIAETSNQQIEWGYGQDISLPAVSRKEVTLYSYSQERFSTVTVLFRSDSGEETRATATVTCFEPGDAIYGVLASSPSAFNVLTTVDPPSGNATLAQLSLEDIPGNYQGLDMLDILAVSDVDTGQLSDTQRQAIELWVSSGGRLLIAGGTAWQKTAAGMENLLPLLPNNSTSLPGLPAFEEFSPGSGSLAEPAVIATGAVDPNSTVLLWQDGIPALIQKSAGYGEVYYFAVDPALAPLRSWDGMEEVYKSLFGSLPDIPGWADGFQEWGSLASAIANIPGLGLPSAVLVCGFLIFYVVALGPINYLILKTFKVRERAWVSIPILVIGFTTIAFLIGTSIRGNRPILHSLSVIQVWPGSGQARVDGAVGIFSPSRDIYHLSIDQPALGHPLPISSFAGDSTWYIEQTSSGFQDKDIRVDIGSIQTITFSGQQPAPLFENQLVLTAESNGLLRLKGFIQNNSEITLTDVMILGPNYVEKVASLPAGGNVDVNAPLTTNGKANAVGQPYSQGYWYNNNTLIDIFGVSYPGGLDADEERRYNLVSGLLGPNGGRGGGYFLIGWNDEQGIQASLDKTNYKTEFTNLYIIHLNLDFSLEAAGQSISVPPPLFTWSIFETPTISNTPTPYDAYFWRGKYSLRFTPTLPVTYERVKDLVFHIDGYPANGIANLEISFWNFFEDRWEFYGDIDWGDNSIVSPGRFVAGNGEVRVQIQNISDTSISLNVADFTLVLEQ